MMEPPLSEGGRKRNRRKVKPDEMAKMEEEDGESDKENENSHGIEKRNSNESNKIAEFYKVKE